MTTKSKPQPGQLWQTDRVGGVAVKTAEGWEWPNGETITVAIRPRGDGPVGYTVEYVEELRKEREGDWSKLSRERLAAEVARDNNEARANMLVESVRIAREERDEAVARAERAETAVLFGATEQEILEDLVEREPWRVLRAAADLAGHAFDFDCRPAALRALADELEREHAETAKRDRLYKLAQEVYDSTPRHCDAIPAMVDAVLAEAVSE